MTTAARRPDWWRLWPLSLAEWRHHPWRYGVALLAVALGVALASSVQMINASALAEFAQAVRSVNGQPDVVLSATQREGFDDAVYARLALDPAVALASPVLEREALARRGPGAPAQPVRLVGVDALKVAATSPDLMPRPHATSGRPGPANGSSSGSGDRGDDADAAAPAPGRGGALGLLAPDQVYLNAAAQQQLGLRPGQTLELATAAGWQRFAMAGHVAAAGPALAVLDIAAAQTRFDRVGRLSRIDLRLAAGTSPAAWRAAWAAAEPSATAAAPASAVTEAATAPATHVSDAAPWPGAAWAQPDDGVQRVSNLSRAYRVNLGVLALVALLVGGFLVYSVVSLSVAQRTPQLALLGVLGLAARDRRALVLAESTAVGLVGSALGLAAGAGLAALALRLLGGDLGGGYFAGAAPALVWPLPWLVACFALGTLAALAGAWFPARQAEALAPAQALKGLGSHTGGRAPVTPGLALLAGGGLLALAPPIAGLPLAAYGAVALLLAGGVVLVPAVVGALLARQASPRQPVALLAWRRAHFARATASATVAGVVASLALSVAITVMVASFREAVTDWLDSVLPADLYVRGTGGAAALPATLVAQASALPGVLRGEAGRQRQLQLRADQPALALLARPLGDDPARRLPLLGPALPASVLKPGEMAGWVTEPAAAIHGWRAGDLITLPLPQATGGVLRLRVRGVWRDYARQFGAVALDATDYRRATGDTEVNDLALWLAPGATLAGVETALQKLAGERTPLETIGTQALRRTSLAIFDRSFAVTLYLQAVAIVVGLVGVAASLSAQVLARRKEFGLLAHLGFTRRQVMALVAAETAAWLSAGVLVGLLLGGAMAVVLVKVVNPQSFHWSMPLQLPALRLAALAGAVLLAGLLTALWSARRAAGRNAVQAVKEDW